MCLSENMSSLVCLREIESSLGVMRMGVVCVFISTCQEVGGGCGSLDKEKAIWE